MDKTNLSLGCILTAFIGVVILLFTTFGTIGAGERGVRTRFGAVVGDPLGEGLYIKIPFIEGIKTMDIKIQKLEVNADSASKDLQTVTTVVALNFKLDSSKVTGLYQSIGMDYKSRMIDPAIQEAVKSSTAKFTAEELITKRSEVREDIKLNLKTKLEPYGIIIDEFNIVNFDFSASFNAAIEKKVTAEQDALAAKNRLEQIKFEAQQKIEEAKGKAEAITIEANALRNNPDVLELRALEKWNGILPQVTGGAVPFINLER